ncbi:MAG: hypothetical protein AAGI71_18835 [Bacteroidota bacterium]
MKGSILKGSIVKGGEGRVAHSGAVDPQSIKLGIGFPGRQTSHAFRIGHPTPYLYESSTFEGFILL